MSRLRLNWCDGKTKIKLRPLAPLAENREKIRKFGMLRKWEDSKKFLQENLQLVCEDTGRSSFLRGRSAKCDVDDETRELTVTREMTKRER